MQLSIFYLQDQPDFIVKYDVVTESLLTDQLHVHNFIWILAFAICLSTASSDSVSYLLLLTKEGILAVTLYCKMSCIANPSSSKTE